jgi:hypothetical protein
MLLDMFRTPLCPSSGASYCCTCSLWSPCGVGSVVSSNLVLLLILQELLIATHAVSGHRVVLGRLFPPALFCCYCCFRVRESSSNNRLLCVTFKQLFTLPPKTPCIFLIWIPITWHCIFRLATMWESVVIFRIQKKGPRTKKKKNSRTLV